MMKLLLWKEWRELRLFILLSIGMIILSRIFFEAVPLYDRREENLAMVITGMFLLPLLFALFLGVIPFTNEFTKKTQSFLLSRPVSVAKIFWTKFLFGLFVLLCLILFSYAVLWIGLGGLDVFEETMIYGCRRLFTHLILPYILIYSAAFFASLLVHSALTAILCTPFILIFGMLVVAPLLVGLVPTVLRIDLVLLSIWILIPFLLVFGFLVWRKGVSKGMNQSRIILQSAVIMLSLYLVIHIASNVLAGRELTRTIQHTRGLGIKLRSEEIVPPSVTEEENAALLCQEAFALIEELSDRYADEWEYMPYEGQARLEELTSEQKKNIAGLLLKNSDFLEFYSLIEKAVSLPSCRFGLNYEDGGAMKLPHLSMMRTLARLVGARAFILVEEQRYKEALQSTRVVLRLGDLLADEPIFISQLVRIGVDGIAMNSLQLVLNISPLEISIKDYQDVIWEIDNKEKGLTKGLEGELARHSANLFERILQGNFKELEYLVHQQRRNVFEDFFWRFYTSYPLRPIQKLDYAFYVRFSTEAILLCRLPYYEARGNLVRLDREIGNVSKQAVGYPLSSMVLLAPLRMQEQQAKYNARLDGLKIALALKIHKAKTGSYPDKLAAIVPEIIPELPPDPFTGKDYIYRKEGEGFFVYSLGEDLRDDGGIYYEGKGLRKRYRRDIVWQCEK